MSDLGVSLLAIGVLAFLVMTFFVVRWVSTPKSASPA